MQHSLRYYGNCIALQMERLTELLSLAAVFIQISVQAVSVTEVALGETAVLNCTSNDDNHRFQFWQLHTNEIIGPGNTPDKSKYKYEVLTGTLYIKSVLADDHGLYTCVCKHLNGRSFNSESVELVVRQDWEELYETDHTTNVFRIVLIIAVAVILAILVYIIYSLRPDRSRMFREMSEEDSPEERGGRAVSSSYKSVQPGTSNNIVSEGLDNPGLDTELPQEFVTVHINDESRM